MFGFPLWLLLALLRYGFGIYYFVMLVKVTTTVEVENDFDLKHFFQNVYTQYYHFITAP